MYKKCLSKFENIFKTAGLKLWRDLTKVISILNLRSQDLHAFAGNWTWASTEGGEHSCKELFEQHVISYLDHYIWACDMASPNAFGYMNNWTYMNTHELHSSPLASRSILNIDIRHLQVHIFKVKQDISQKGHQCGDTWPRSSPSVTWGPETDMSWLGTESRPLLWEATTLATSYSNTMLIAMRNIYSPWQ
jgi:hypothetical protein